MRLPLLHLCLISQGHLLLSRVVSVLPAEVNIVACLCSCFSCGRFEDCQSPFVAIN